MGQFAKILPSDVAARRNFVSSGGLKKIQELQPAQGSPLAESIRAINEVYPEEIVRYYSPGYSKILLDRITEAAPPATQLQAPTAERPQSAIKPAQTDAVTAPASAAPPQGEGVPVPTETAAATSNAPAVMRPISANTSGPLNVTAVAAEAAPAAAAGSIEAPSNDKPAA